MKNMKALSIQLALSGGLALFATAACAQSWQTVDDYQFTAGYDSQNQALAFTPSGALLAGGVDDSWCVGLVRASTDSGATWSAPLDTFDFAGWGVFNCAGVVSDPAGNLYAAYTGYPTSDSGLDMHWLVRRSADGGLTWTTVDDFDPGGSQTQANSITTDAAGNVFVAGIAQYPNGTGGWTVRKGTAGANFTTVDTVSSSLGALSVFVHPTAGVFAVGQADVAVKQTIVRAWLIRRSQDGGRTWITVDTVYSLSKGSYYYGRAYSVGADTHGNLYVAGTLAAPTKSGTVWQWVVRKSTNAGSSWSTVDTYQLSPASGSMASAFVADSNGNLYVAGFGNDPQGAHWVVRESAAGTGAWQTVDTFQYVSGSSSQAQAIAANALGNIFVGGWGYDSAGSQHWLVRKR